MLSNRAATRLYGAAGPTIVKMCRNCNHPASWHRHDDADNVPPTDPDCKFRCIGYNCEVGGRPPLNPCTCPDFEAWHD